MITDIEADLEYNLKARRADEKIIAAQAAQIAKLTDALQKTLYALQVWKPLHPDEWDIGDIDAEKMASSLLAELAAK